MVPHPVVELLHTRRAKKSQPGARTDTARLALVVEGGGMRGVVSSAMTDALESAVFTPCFDLVVGCSAGALNAAALLAGVAAGCTAEYAGAFTSRQFIDPLRLLFGRPAVDVDFVLKHASDLLDSERHARTLASPIPLHCIATDVDTTEAGVLTGMRTLEELRLALLATSRLPWVAGAPVAFRGRRWLDGGLVEAVPLATALSLGATHALVLQTRPEGVRYPGSEGLADRLVERHLRALNPALVERYRARGRAYDTACEAIVAAEAAGRETAPQVLALRPPAGSVSVGRLERRAQVLRAAAEEARGVVRARLGTA